MPPIARKMPRIQSVVLPLLRARLDPSIKVHSWGSDILDRTFPYVMIRRLGGLPVDVDLLDRPVIEMTSYGSVSLAATEDLYLDCRQIIWDAWKNQTVVPGEGYIHSYFETLGPTQFDSPWDDTWRIQGLIQLGLRPAKE
jgi:hypothetical protein